MPRVKVELPEKFSFSTSLSVRVGDVNYGGHLGNDSLLLLLHEARLQLLTHIGCTEMNACGVGLIMADAAVVYKGEGFYGDTLKIEIEAGEFVTRGFTLFYRVTCEREQRVVPIAEARTGILCFDYVARKVVSLPEALRKKLER
jgi:acyl-CoA thioesterase FadM